MKKEKMKYIKNKKIYDKLVRAELLFMPMLIIEPILISVFFIYDWYTRGFLLNNSAYDIELILGVIILIGNIMFDIPFVKSLKAASKME
jgi:hypothetical protein